MSADTYLSQMMAQTEEYQDWEEMSQIFRKLAIYAHNRHMARVAWDEGRKKFARELDREAEKVYRSLPPRAQWKGLGTIQTEPGPMKKGKTDETAHE